MSDHGMSCEKCIFWDGTFCRSNPPTVITVTLFDATTNQPYKQSVRSVWPYTKAEDFCGDFDAGK